jgi:hypothetical protein
MKTFEDKLLEQFTSLNISVLSEPHYQYHLYADYIELVSLITDGNLSRSDVIDRFKDNGMLTIEKESLDGETGLFDAEITDQNENWIISLFDILLERKIIFEDDYPFLVDNCGISKKEGIKTAKQMLYIYLLISSSLKFFKKVQHELTTDFEKMSELVLKEFLPPNAFIENFGKRSDYEGNAKTKIKDLALKIGIEIDEYEFNQISDLNSKEEGLDVVGWIPFKDRNPNTIIILAQCGCGKDWTGKMFETSRYKNFYRFYKHPPIHSLFIPYALSNKEGKFYQSKDIIEPTLVFERKRILEYSGKINFDDSFLSKKIVDRCLGFKEDIV